MDIGDLVYRKINHEQTVNRWLVPHKGIHVHYVDEIYRVKRTKHARLNFSFNNSISKYTLLLNSGETFCNT